jgi:hypothetical protein
VAAPRPSRRQQQQDGGEGAARTHLCLWGRSRAVGRAPAVLQVTPSIVHIDACELWSSYNACTPLILIVK